jgi:2-succinyl-6-hydroxy-2,4-cyclohexadiene-1-carboxylate synthase
VLWADELGAGRRVVFVHGFTQTGQSWRQIAGSFAGRHHVVLVDAPGHGRSSGVRCDLVEGARQLGDRGGKATYVGYSMGGRLALHLAVADPGLVERLVLIGATPGIEDPEERAVRRATDEELAESLERDGLELFLERWLASPLFATLPPGAADVRDRLTNTVDGLASSLRLSGTGTQEPLWARLHELRLPVDLIVGEHDTKFRGIAERMFEEMSAPATLRVIAGAGHAVHLERPHDVRVALEEILSR